MASRDAGKDGAKNGGAKKQAAAATNQTAIKAERAEVENAKKSTKQAEQIKKEPEKGKSTGSFDERASDPSYKMRLCKNFSADGSCKFGEKCLFAHGQHELRNGTESKNTKPTTPVVTQAAIGSTSEIREKNVEVFVCASCPDAYQDEVSNVCRNLGIQKAYGRAGDMLDSLSGKDWLGKWEAKVVMATVTKAHTLDARKARIICISGGPHCDLEVAQQPRLVRAIKQEMDNEEFIVKVEWMEMRQFREDYAAGYNGVALTVEGGSKPGTDKFKPDVKSRPASAATGDSRGKPSGEAGAKQAAGDAKGKHPTSDSGGGKQQGNDGKGKPSSGEGKGKQTGGDAGRKQPGSPVVGGEGQGKKAGGKPELEAKQVARQSPKVTEVDAGGKKARDQPKGKQAGDDAAGGGRSGGKQSGGDGTARPATADGRSKSDGRPAGSSKRSAGAEAGKDRRPSRAWGCKQCGKQFPARYALEQHQSGTGHAGVSRGAPDAAKPAKDVPALTVWTCGECEREFASEAALDQHQTATGHSDPTCGCGRTFGSRGALQQHLDATGHDPMSSSEDSGDDDWADALESTKPAGDEGKRDAAERARRDNLNTDGFPMHFGTGWDATTLYCGRRLGEQAIPGSDGQCGPNNGPQCASCKAASSRFNPASGAARAGGGEDAQMEGLAGLLLQHFGLSDSPEQSLPVRQKSAGGGGRGQDTAESGGGSKAAVAVAAAAAVAVAAAAGLSLYGLSRGEDEEEGKARKGGAQSRVK